MMNLKKNTILILFIFISIHSFSQLQVYDIVNKSPVENVLIIQDHLLRATSDKNGRFIIDLTNKKDSVRFYHMGYKVLNVSVNDLHYQKDFFLEPIENELNEVTVTQNYKRLEVYPVKRNINFLMINQPAKIWYSSQIALYVPHTMEFSEYFIDKIFIHTMKGYWDKDDSSKYAPFKVNIYDVDSITKLPGKKLFKDNYVIQRSLDEDRIEVSLFERLDFPIEGIFIVIETYNQDQSDVRPAFRRIKKVKKSKYESYFKSLLVKEGKYSEWTSHSDMSIEANYYFGLELIKFDN
ncbi:hypothetical protein ACFS5J_04910 [Flavobacterium chuncheonense]|uniref:Carboxypeptidase-like regulatory domain-containing protein n=1 Tax=Flavobacterium chuncheonense TaxID=2026653 RepID=A0ABW5YK23_9FLAO